MYDIYSLSLPSPIDGLAVPYSAANLSLLLLRPSHSLVRSYLPLAHVFERANEQLCLSTGHAVGYYSGVCRWGMHSHLRSCSSGCVASINCIAGRNTCRCSFRLSA